MVFVVACCVCIYMYLVSKLPFWLLLLLADCCVAVCAGVSFLSTLWDRQRQSQALHNAVDNT
jgi:hypothetical protein